MSSPEPFALLLPVYHADRPDYVRAAFRSAVHDQTLRPDVVILVRDGQIGPELTACLDELRADSPVPVTLVPIEESTGLGPALDAGLAASPHDIVARMDADDIAAPQRFAVQLPLIRAGADIVGAGLFEFETDTSQVVGQRTPPTKPDDIRRYAHMHDPFNHPTVVYRRAAVQKAGGYGQVPLMEDYWLFARMLDAGAEPRNVPDPLVYYRVGAGAYQRRGGRDQLRAEIALQRRMLDAGFTSRGQFVRNVIIRGGYRLLPWRFRRTIYRRIVAGWGARRGRAMSPVTSHPEQAAHTALPAPLDRTDTTSPPTSPSQQENA